MAIEYIRALGNIKSNIIPFAVKRMGAMHGSNITENEFLDNAKVNGISLREYLDGYGLTI